VAEKKRHRIRGRDAVDNFVEKPAALPQKPHGKCTHPGQRKIDRKYGPIHFKHLARTHWRTGKNCRAALGPLHLRRICE
jgi:hypothetical protein